VVEVRIEGRRLDVFEGFDFSFNYGIADIRNPEKRSTEYSKTIKCPATKNNDELFGHIYDVNISNNYDANTTNISVNFNPNKKAEARVIADGVEVMAGVVQLRKIVQKGHAYTYEVVFIGKLVNIFSVLGDKKINEELDFSDLNHELTQANVVSSWSNTDGYVYPYIDYGKRIEFNNVGRVFYPNDLRPAIFAKTILNKIFDFAGFSYQSSFFSSQLWNQLIVPFTGLNVYADQAQVQSRGLRASLSSPTDPFTTSNTIPSQSNSDWDRFNLICDNDSTGGNYDGGNNYTSGTYFVPAGGIYTFSSEVKLKLVRTLFSPQRTYDGVLLIHSRIRKLDTSFALSTVAESTLSFQLVNNPQSVLEEITINVTADELTLFQNERIYIDVIVDFSELLVQNLSGQEISGRNLYTDFALTIETAKIECNASNTIFEGDNVLMTEISPQCTMADFLTSIFKMFNLFVEVDTNNERNLLIETRDTFYSKGGTKDWTYKLARDKDITLEPLGVLTDREYIYTYSEDGDYYNERYQSNRGHVYGRARIEVDNDFVQSSKEVEVIFSPSPLVNDTPSNRLIPKIYDADISEGAQPTDANIRILYFQNLPSSPSWELASYFNPTLTQTTYPYAGHWDNPITPTVDINFGLPLELFYQANSYTGTLQVTNANLYNIYHRNYINEVTDKDSKVMTGMFYLEPTDINTLDFRDQIVIDNSYWRLNKVMNYNPFKEGLTKVELIKIKEAVTFQKSEKSLNSGGYLGKEKMPSPSTEIKTNGNKYPPFQGKVSGADNRVGDSVTAFKIVGSRNTIGEGSKNITIFGNDNEVAGGLHNVQLINTNGVIITESNKTFVNGKEQDNVEILDGGLNEVRALNGGTNIFAVDGGEDIVQTQFSEIAIYNIEGGVD
jgi:hypothetical protein